MQIAKEYFLRHFGELVIPVRLRTFFTYFLSTSFYFLFTSDVQTEEYFLRI